MKTMKEIFDGIFVHDLTPHRMPDGSIRAYTDKNTHHCYVDQVYEELFASYRKSAKKILEVGIYGGGSMLLWKQYFPNAEITALDIQHSVAVDFFKDEDRITQIIGDAYSDETVNQFKNEEFDICLDDGPHTLESFNLFIDKYLPKVKKGGLLVIEDIYDINIVSEMMKHVPEELHDNVKVYDLRNIRGLADDIVFVIKK